MEVLMATQYLQLQDGKIAYEESGAGPLVVCVPGMGDLRSEYRYLAPQLVAAGYRVVAMDVRGHGETSPSWPDYSVAAVGRDVLALIRSLDAGPAIVIGTSMAAGAAVWAAVEAPEWVARLVLIGPAVHGDLSALNELLYGSLFMRPWGPSVWLSYFSSLFPTNPPEDFSEYRARLRANLRQPGRMEALRRMIFASKAASEERLSQVSVPTLVIMGGKDRDFKDPEAEARWVAQRVHARYVMVPDSGHYPHVEFPDLAIPLVLGFLQDQPVEVEKAYVA
jgi:pimeloyl-ACP methyl ester carboxylesterase